MTTAHNLEDRSDPGQETLAITERAPSDASTSISLPTLPNVDKQEFSIANLSLVLSEQGIDRTQIFLQFKESENTALGEITIRNMATQNVPDFVGLLNQSLEEHKSDTERGRAHLNISAETLSQALNSLGSEVSIESSLGQNIDQIVMEYKKLLQAENKPQRSKVRTICGKGISETMDELSWVDIENLNRETAIEMAKKLGVSQGTVMHCLEKRSLSQAFTRNGYLYLCFPEFADLPNDRYSIEFSSVHMLLAENRLITIHSDPSKTVSWIEEELRGKSLDQSDKQYSSHLAGRMIGSAVAGYKQFLIEYSKRVLDLVDDFTKGDVNHKSFVAANKVQRSLGAVESQLTHLVSTTSALDDPKHKYGAPETMEALQRFGAQALTLKESAGLLKAELKNARDNLDAENETRRTESSFSMSVLGNLLAPPAVYAGIVQTAAAVGSVMPATWFYLGLAGPAIVSGILTGSFIYRAKSRNNGIE